MNHKQSEETTSSRKNYTINLMIISNNKSVRSKRCNIKQQNMPIQDRKQSLQIGALATTVSRQYTPLVGCTALANKLIGHWYH